MDIRLLSRDMRFNTTDGAYTISSRLGNDVMLSPWNIQLCNNKWSSVRYVNILFVISSSTSHSYPGKRIVCLNTIRRNDHSVHDHVADKQTTLDPRQHYNVGSTSTLQHNVDLNKTEFGSYALP